MATGSSHGTRRSKRVLRSGKATRVVYDQKYHPMDQVLRPYSTTTLKHRLDDSEDSIDRDDSDSIDSDDSDSQSELENTTEGADSPGKQPHANTRRRSSRVTASKHRMYDTRYHPADQYLKGHTSDHRAKKARSARSESPLFMSSSSKPDNSTILASVEHDEQNILVRSFRPAWDLLEPFDKRLCSLQEGLLGRADTSDHMWEQAARTMVHEKWLTEIQLHDWGGPPALKNRYKYILKHLHYEDKESEPEVKDEQHLSDLENDVLGGYSEQPERLLSPAESSLSDIIHVVPDDTANEVEADSEDNLIFEDNEPVEVDLSNVSESSGVLENIIGVDRRIPTDSKPYMEASAYGYDGSSDEDGLSGRFHGPRRIAYHERISRGSRVSPDSEDTLPPTLDGELHGPEYHGARIYAEDIQDALEDDEVLPATAEISLSTHTTTPIRLCDEPRRSYSNSPKCHLRRTERDSPKTGSELRPEVPPSKSTQAKDKKLKSPESFSCPHKGINSCVLDQPEVELHLTMPSTKRRANSLEAFTLASPIVSRRRRVAYSRGAQTSGLDFVIYEDDDATTPASYQALARRALILSDGKENTEQLESDGENSRQVYEYE